MALLKDDTHKLKRKMMACWEFGRGSVIFELLR